MLKLKASLYNIFNDVYRFNTKGMYIRDKVAQVVHIAHMSRDARKPVFGVSGQVLHKPACAITEGG